MELTILGYLLVPLGIVLFFRPRRYLFWAMVISAPFFDTSVINLPGLTTLVRPSYYFGGLFVLRYLLDFGARQDTLRITREVVLSVVFLSAIMISSVMPFFMPGEIYVIPTESSIVTTYLVEYEALAFSRASLTQLLYPFFLILCFVLTADYLSKNGQQQQVIRILVWAALPIVFSGILYILLVILGFDGLMERLYWLINGERELRIREQMGIGGLPLMYSLAGEPGYTGMYLLLALGPILAALYYRDIKPFRSRSVNLFVLVLIVVTLIAAGGTTGYVGLVILCTVSLVILLFGEGRMRVIASAYVRIAVLVVAVAVIATVGYNWFFESSFADYISTVHLSKVQGQYGSGVVRKEITLHNLQTFAHSPLFGVGYGNDRGLAMSAFLLANIGIVGTSLFYLLIFGVIMKGWRNLRAPTIPDTDKPLVFGMLVSLITLFLLMQFAKSESALLFMYFWILLACVASYKIPAVSEPASPDSPAAPGLTGSG